ncbi:integrase [Actinoplanes campanulatus]|uniref:Integrase n=1 Tax=Actinoplanes campanulatus TaxID=113559 RepID=A0A7W5ANF0_9ACTN|nr:site-specific integrase [Actinoplanes campanulatus]MBB3099360.1 integrase [Actinoplanes campanulatus]GGN40308.1 site-specific integrase [Actinoplanes campanulatus]GID40677.1 site-specific integrase [Actinoplanes campanulatus]
MPRNRYPTIRKGADGLWHAWITVGTKPNGRPDQRHIKRETKTLVEDRIDELLDQVRGGAVVKPGRPDSVAQWLDTYLTTVAPRRCDPGTVKDYRSKIDHWVLPVIGSTRLDRLQPHQLEEVYLGMQRAGRADSTQLKVHRILSRALEVALRRRLVTRNVAKLIDAPTTEQIEQAALTREDAVAVLDAAAGRRNATRWSLALALGLRQGEALGLRWSHVDLDRGEIRVFWQLRRRAFDHGCDGACGRRRGGNCPQRSMTLRSAESTVLDLSKPPDSDRRTGLVLKSPKGKSKRTVPIPDQLIEQLRRHQTEQGIERILADDAWQDHGFVFARLDGQPIDPGPDHREWKALLSAAGVPESRLHDARHTAGTMMAALGVPLQVVQEVLGHSDLRTARRYVHVASEMARAATERIGGALFREVVHPDLHP